MTITHDVPLDRISDLLCCAFEGGSNYWYEIVEFVRPSKFTFLPCKDLTSDPDKFKHLSYPLNPNGALVIKCDEKPRSVLNLGSVLRGLQLFATSKEYAHHWRDFLAENDDAITGDVFLQFCLFGEVIYG